MVAASSYHALHLPFDWQALTRVDIFRFSKLQWLIVLLLLMRLSNMRKLR